MSSGILRGEIPRTIPAREVDPAGNTIKGKGATRKVAPFLSALLAVAIASSSSTASSATQNSHPLNRQPSIGAAPFPGLPPGPERTSATASVTPEASVAQSTPTPANTASSGNPTASASHTPGPTKQQGGAGSGPKFNTCDARYELGPDGRTLEVLVLTDVDPPSTLYTGFLVDDANGNAAGKMWRGNHFTTPWDRVTPLAFIAIDAATLPPGMLAGPTGTLPAGQLGYAFCGSLIP